MNAPIKVTVTLLLILLKILVTPFLDLIVDSVGILLTEFDKFLLINFQIIDEGFDICSPSQ